jgi:acyl-CoA dehydrogenase
MEDALTDALSAALQQLLQDRSTPAAVRGVEAGGDHAALWAEIEASGFADALVPEAEGGAGLPLPDAFALLELCGRHALPVPLAPTLLARGLLAQSGIARPAGSVAIADVAARCGAVLRCAQVASGRVADHVLVTVDGATLLLPAAAADREPGVFPLDATLAWDAAALRAAVPVGGPHDLATLAACAAAAQIAGSLMAVFERTLQYANERQQFGRPIGKFQAIQHQLAVLSEHTFAARMAAQIGCQCAGVVPDRLRVAVAKARTSAAAMEGAAIAHAIHGAIGFTAEYALQLHTRRLHAWRQAAGSEGHWHTVLGEALLATGAPALDMIRATTDPH